MSRTRQGSALWALAPFVLLVFGGWQTVTVLSRMPAFNWSLQEKAAGWGNAPALLEANFDRADYYYWIALGWWNRTGLEAAQVQETTPFQVEENLERNNLISDLAEQSLRYNPGDAQTWMLLARAKAKTGDIDGALAALRASFERDRYHGPLSYERLVFLIQLMDRPTARDLALSTVSPEMVRSQLEAVRSHHIFGNLADSLSQVPPLVAIMEDMRDEGVVADE